MALSDVSLLISHLCLFLFLCCALHNRNKSGSEIRQEGCGIAGPGAMPTWGEWTSRNFKAALARPGEGCFTAALASLPNTSVIWKAIERCLLDKGEAVSIVGSFLPFPASCILKKHQ